MKKILSLVFLSFNLLTSVFGSIVADEADNNTYLT
jgi:hypothetical protein